MMLLLGLLDILASFLLLSRIFDVSVPLGVVIAIPAALLFKTFMFGFDLIGGCTDLIVVLLIILTIFFNLPWWLLLIPALFIFIKGIMSFIHL